MDWKEALAALGASGELPPGEPEPQPEQPKEPETQREPLRLYLDRKKRRGKEATVIEGFLCSSERHAEICSRLQRSLGCGGSRRDGEILLQGDVRDRASEMLHDLGFKTKKCN